MRDWALQDPRASTVSPTTRSPRELGCMEYQLSWAPFKVLSHPQGHWCALAGEVTVVCFTGCSSAPPLPRLCDLLPSCPQQPVRFAQLTSTMCASSLGAQSHVSQLCTEQGMSRARRPQSKGSLSASRVFQYSFHPHDRRGVLQLLEHIKATAKDSIL